MNKLKSGYENVNYSTNTDGDMLIDTIKWNFAKLRSVLDDVEGKCGTVMNIELPTDTSQSTFRVRLEFPSQINDIIEIYYSSPYTVCIIGILEIACVYDRNGTEKIVVEKKEFHTVKPNSWLYFCSISKSSFDRNSRGRITLDFKYPRTSIDNENCETSKISLWNDIKVLLNNGLFSDMTMRSAEGTEFKVHKAVLASRSAVLKSHIELNTEESYTNIIESKLVAEVLQEVLTFIYSDKAPRVDEIPEMLLAAADYYQLEGLKILCLETLNKKLTDQNALQMLELADSYSVGTLKEKALEFIKNSPWVIITTEGWANIKSVELVKSICEYVMGDGADI